MNETHFDLMSFYASLGYYVTLSHIGNIETIKMVKEYSYVTEDTIVCEQAQDYDDLKNFVRFRDICSYMYDKIQEKEDNFKAQTR